MPTRIFIFVLTILLCFFSGKGGANPPTEGEASNSNNTMQEALIQKGEPQENELLQAPPSYEATFLKMMLTLLGLLGVLILGVWLVRRLSSGHLRQLNFNRRIKILEKRPLSAKSILYLIEIEGKHVLISESQLEVRNITSLESTSFSEES